MRTTRKNVCPKCGSEKVELLNHGRMVGAGLGLIAGTLASATQHEMIGNIADKAAAKLVTSAVANFRPTEISRAVGVGGLAIFAFGTIGLIVGGLCGSRVDRAILNSCKCHECSHTFSVQQNF